MVRSVILILIAGISFVLVGAHQTAPSNMATKKRNCTGYSVIEVDKGIDCNGDTIHLVKVNGFFERASL
jgi:hypothetical protein